MLAFRRREAMAKDPMAQSRLKNTKNGFEQRRVSNPMLGLTRSLPTCPACLNRLVALVIGHRGLQANRALEVASAKIRLRLSPPRRKAVPNGVNSTCKSLRMAFLSRGTTTSVIARRVKVHWNILAFERLNGPI